jgi:hypothetical protein
MEVRMQDIEQQSSELEKKIMEQGAAMHIKIRKTGRLLKMAEE